MKIKKTLTSNLNKTRSSSVKGVRMKIKSTLTLNLKSK